MRYRIAGLCLFLGAHALVAATLTGTVINSTTGKPAVGDQVLLLKVVSGRASVAGRGLTDASGRFHLTADLPANSRGIRVIHQGVGYDKPAPAGAKEINFYVYDAAEKLRGVTATSYLERLQAAGGKLGVVDEITLNNASDPPRTLAGRHPFEIHLPAGAEVIDGRMLRPGGRAAAYKPIPSGQPDRYYFPVPLLPGETRFAVAYQVTYRGEANLAPGISLPVERLTIQYPKSMNFESKVPGMFQAKPAQGDLQVTEAGNPVQAPAFRIWGSGTLAVAQSVQPGATPPKPAAPGAFQISSRARVAARVKPSPTSQYGGFLLGAAALVLAGAAAGVIAHRRKQTRRHHSSVAMAPAGCSQ